MSAPLVVARRAALADYVELTKPKISVVTLLAEVGRAGATTGTVWAVAIAGGANGRVSAVQEAPSHHR